jgi:drug/metabolite transporter (DMT)-like permease
MIWLLLSILTNTALLLILKSFTRFGVNTLQAIVVNYFVAGSTGLFLSGIPFPVSEIPQQAWWWIPLMLGFLFISIFLLIAKTAQTIGVSSATVANKMSVVIPVLAAVWFYGESITALKIIGLLIAVVAVYFTSVPAKKEARKTLHYFWMPALIFIGSGIIDALINHAKTTKIVPDAHVPFFISLSFLTAGIIGVTVITIRIFRFHEKFQLKSVAAGIILGIPNYFSIYGITRALGCNIMESSALYPVNNMGIVALSAIGALLFFKEKFSILNWLGILLSLGAIALVAFS